MFTAYELMRRRFGERMRKLTASIFLVTRALAEGVRVFAVSLVVSIVLGTGEIASIVLITALTLFYTFEGGMTAVIWTDVVQMSPLRRGRGGELRRSFWRRFPAAGRTWRRWPGRPQIRDFRFSLRSHDGILRAPLYLLGGGGGRMLPDHRQPRHRSAHGAVAAERAQREPEPRGAAGELGGDCVSIHAVSADRRRCCLYITATRGLRGARASRPHLSRISVAAICRRAWRGFRWRRFWRRPWPI